MTRRAVLRHVHRASSRGCSDRRRLTRAVERGGDWRGSGETRGEPAARPCPNCAATTSPDERFCLLCGYEYATGTLPTAPPLQLAGPGAVWEAVVEADEEYFRRGKADGVTFPAACQRRFFKLTELSVLIGRRSGVRGVELDIDLSGPPEDPGVTHVHAALVREHDGSYAVVDLNSTNGTRVNDDGPLPRGKRVRLRDGDRIYLGSWSRILIRLRRASPDT